MFPRVTRYSSLRIAFVFLICLSLTFSNLYWLKSSAQGQGAAHSARPQHRKPEGSLPDLEAVKSEANVEREAPAPIPSTMRAKRNEGRPWDGRRVGDPGTSDGQIQRAHARRRVAVPPLSEEQFIQNFFSLALLRSPTADETLYWNNLLRAGYNQNQTSLKLAAIEFGRTLFESASYAARNRDAHSYVYDLYKTYLLREPDAGGWAYWEALVPTYGREYVRRGFEESGEFATVLATVSLSGAANTNAASLITARLEPRNQPGNGLLSRDVSWSVPLLSLPGRNGLNLGLALSYSSMVWTRSGPYFYFDEDNGFPSPGFRLGFPTVQRKTFDAQTGKNVYLLLTPAGRRVALRQTTTATVYEAADSSYLQLIETGATLLVRSTDGTQLSLVEANNEYRCAQVKDRNGNYLSVTYNAQGQLANITDTLGRLITFNYDSNANLLSITQAWNGQSHQWVSFGWSTRNMQNGFAEAAVVGIKNGVTVPVLTQVALNDTSYFTFDYTNSLQVSQIRNYLGAQERNATVFTYETTAGDVPRLSSSSVSAQNWTGVNGVPAQVTTQYSVAGDGACVLTAPDGTVYKEYYGTGWQKGLTTLSEIWSGGVKQKWTATAWTQDNTAVSYETNPRVIETNVYDAGGNRRRTVIDYGQYASWGLPYGVREYAADGVTEVRQTWTDYNLSQAYLDRRLIGLVSAVHLTNVSSWQGKITYEYDDPARLSALPAAATQHDAAYNTSFTVRGNVTSVSQWDFTDISNASKKLTSYTNYFVTGTPASSTDPSTHTSTISYTDAFSDGVTRNPTFAYPTTLTDAGGYSSTVQYNYDFGATTRTQSPAPANQAQGRIQTMTYNNLGQLERVTTENNGAYRRFWYGPNYVASYATVNNVADELYAIQVMDGLGRVIGAAGNHPNSNGGYRLVVTVYDQMGRATNVSNPTEVNNSWVAIGDDAAGIYYTQQTYDWKGRPLVTTNPDSTTTTASYSGCGCAGGEVVTVTDQGTMDGGVGKRRQQRSYADVFGRTVKTEVLNWQGGSVYSTTVNTYNVRDQLTQQRQYVGAEGSGSFQDTTFTYDGYARLKTRHQPEQQVDPTNSYSSDHTTWNYNADDTVQAVTDARGASQSFAYNGRHLVTGITYAAPSGVTTIAPVQPVAYSYDAARNRTAMLDGNGRTDYSYDQLSRMLSETRQFNGVTGSYALNYDYNLAGELKAITDPTGATINYGFDALGRVANVSGSTYGGVTQYASVFAYRAWGALKGLTYGNNLTLALSYNARLKATQFEVAGRPAQYGSASVMKTQYQYYDDGALKYADDLLDNRFDRAYGYDQLTRLKEDYSGSEASDFVNQTSSGGTTTGPYRQSYSYDGWSNFTSRTGRFWSKSTTFTASYSNGRNTNSLWQYDADGRVVRESMLKYTFDAAGRNVTTANILVNQFVGGEVSQTRDGDGLEIKREETRQGTTTIGYRLRSSVLGGQVVTELNATGQKQKSYVYLGGERLAEQEGGSVIWKHTNPLTGSEGSSYASGLYIPEKELDPTLVDVGFQDPYLNFEEPQPDSLRLLGGNSNGLCTVEGMSWDCMSAKRLQELGVAGEVISTTVYAIYRDGRMKQVWTGLAQPDPLGRAVSSSPVGSPGGATGSNGHAPDTGSVVLAGTNDSSVTVVAGADYVSTGPQNSYSEVFQKVGEVLRESKCARFARDILQAVSGKKNPVYPKGGTLLDVFHEFLKQNVPQALFTKDLPDGTLGYGNPVGNISQGTAQIAVPGFPYADDIIGELFHLAGKNKFYTDKQLAEAVRMFSEYAKVADQALEPSVNIYDSRYQPLPDWTEANEGGYSAYFHYAQYNICFTAPPTTHMKRLIR